MGRTEKFSFEIETDNTEKVLGELDEAINRALEAIGIQVENYAKLGCPVDTGLLRNSITHAVGGQQAAIGSYTADHGGGSGSYTGLAPNEKAVFVGSNVEYSPYVELGTQRTKAQPFLKPAVMDHVSELESLAKDALSGF